jgi:WD40 repeat protein
MNVFRSKQLLLVFLLATFLACSVGQVRASALRVKTLTYRETLDGPLAFSPDGRWLACGCGNQDMLIWDLQRRQIIHRLHPEATLHYSVTFSPDSKIVATGGGDGNVSLWDVLTGKLLRILKGVDGGNRSYRVEFTSDGRTLAAVAYHGFIEFWDIRSGKRIRELKTGWRAWTLSISPDGNTIAVSGSDVGRDYDDYIDLFSVQTCLPLRRIVPKRSPNSAYDMSSIAYSPDGKLIAGGSDRTLWLWNAKTGRLRKTLVLRKNGDYTVSLLSFLPGGKTLMSACDDGAVYFCSVKSRRVIRVMNVGKDTDRFRLSSFALSPNGRTLAYKINGVVRLCNIAQFP